MTNLNGMCKSGRRTRTSSPVGKTTVYTSVVRRTNLNFFFPCAYGESVKSRFVYRSKTVLGHPVHNTYSNNIFSHRPRTYTYILCYTEFKYYIIPRRNIN